MSALPKITNLGTLKSPKINEKLAVEIWHQKTPKKSILDASWPKMDPKSCPKGGSRRGPKTDFFGSWSFLGTKWHQEPPKSPPKAKKGPRGHQGDIVLGRGFGRVLGPCWPQEPPKSHSKCIQNFHRFWCPFFIDFSSILDGFWKGFGRHVGLQEALKIKLQYWLDFWSIFYRFFINLGRPESLFLTNTLREIPLFQNLLSYWFFGFLSILGAMLASKTHPKSLKNRSKTSSKKGLT